MSQYGTAKVNFNFDADFKLESGEVDLLLPFASYSEGDRASTWFVQPGVVINNDTNYNGRDFAHIGLGYRRMNGNSRYGINAFYDHDLVRDHRRASIGAEYGINNINLSGNYYFPLSDWQRSDDFFDECWRPDVR